MHFFKKPATNITRIPAATVETLAAKLVDEIPRNVAIGVLVCFAIMVSAFAIYMKYCDRTTDNINRNTEAPALTPPGMV